jgi:alpha/beta superfamily hydrolase
MKEQTFFLDGPVGKLEVLTDFVESPKGVAVICHPHPQQGGNMQHKVVTTLHKAFHESGMNTVRFNYRGVGESEGQYGNMVGEVEDLMTVLAWVEKNITNLPLYLAGFSFGSYISYAAATTTYKDKVKQLFSIAPPVQYPEFHALPVPICPWVVVQGEEDEIVDAQAVYGWLETLGNPATLIRFPQTGHFFHGKLVELKEALLPHIL